MFFGWSAEDGSCCDDGMISKHSNVQSNVSRFQLSAGLAIWNELTGLSIRNLLNDLKGCSIQNGYRPLLRICYDRGSITPLIPTLRDLILIVAYWPLCLFDWDRITSVHTQDVEVQAHLFNLQSVENLRVRNEFDNSRLLTMEMPKHFFSYYRTGSNKLHFYRCSDLNRNLLQTQSLARCVLFGYFQFIRASWIPIYTLLKNLSMSLEIPL